MSYSNERHYRSRTHNDLVTDPAYMPQKNHTMNNMNVHDLNYELKRKLAKARRSKMYEQKKMQVQSYYTEHHSNKPYESSKKYIENSASSGASRNDSFVNQLG